MIEKYEKIQLLLANGERDIRAAVELAKNDDCDFFSSIICFHCQQAVEKHFKAYLMYNETAPPKTHDLLRLASQCSVFDNAFANFDLDDFASYGVDIRYDAPHPSLDDAKRAIEVAKETMDYVIKKISEGESDE
jgi:HEPN domain-containing protein